MTPMERALRTMARDLRHGPHKNVAINAADALGSALVALKEARDWIETVGHDGLEGGIADRIGQAIEKAGGQ